MNNPSQPERDYEIPFVLLETTEIDFAAEKGLDIRGIPVGGFERCEVLLPTSEFDCGYRNADNGQKNTSLNGTISESIHPTTENPKPLNLDTKDNLKK
jgi:hypothetical protein